MHIIKANTISLNLTKEIIEKNEAFPFCYLCNFYLFIFLLLNLNLKKMKLARPYTMEWTLNSTRTRIEITNKNGKESKGGKMNKRLSKCKYT